jgi:hypothetical protein
VPAELYLEWLAFDSIEPVNPAGAILQGLMGNPKSEPVAHAQTWEEQFTLMSKNAVKK